MAIAIWQNGLHNIAFCRIAVGHFFSNRDMPFVNPSRDTDERTRTVEPAMDARTRPFPLASASPEDTSFRSSNGGVSQPRPGPINGPREAVLSLASYRRTVQAPYPVLYSDASVMPTHIGLDQWLAANTTFMLERDRLIPHARSAQTEWLQAVSLVARKRQRRLFDLIENSLPQTFLLEPGEFENTVVVIAGAHGICSDWVYGEYTRQHALTASECAVLSLLLQGLPAKRIASARKSSEATIRTQIRAILTKCGFHSQIALALHIARLPKPSRFE
ncbi:MAG: LuxR C-terminal-related transcriptional regulator [Burkholderiaceae bacterium]